MLEIYIAMSADQVGGCESRIIVSEGCVVGELVGLLKEATLPIVPYLDLYLMRISSLLLKQLDGILL